MVCPSCGKEVPVGAAKCPSCNVPIITVVATKKRKWTATDIIEIIPFIVLGGVLLIAGAILFAQHIGPAWAILSNMSGTGGQGLATVLEAFSDLMWALGGLFLLFAGIMSAAKAKGMNQANTATVLMLLGFGAQAVRFVIINYNAIAGRSPWSGVDWLPLAIQAILIAVVLILISLKKRAKKRLRAKQAAEKAQALKTAQELGAAMGAAEAQAEQQAAPPSTPPQA